MSDTVKLAMLLPDGLADLGEEVRGRLSDEDRSSCAAAAWDMVGPQLRSALEGVLDCDLFELLAKAWAASDLLASYGDPALHPPGERALVELAGHELVREVKPVITVTVGPCPPVELEFALALTASFTGVRLAIADRHIVGGDLGAAKASAQLSLNGKPLHEPKDSREIALPGRFELDPPGVALGRRPAAPAQA